MQVFSIVFIGLAMSTDAFAAAISKGSAMRRPTVPQALRAGLIFGVIEGCTPLLGWVLGVAAARYIAAWDHWLAFGMLSLLGLHMMSSAMKTQAKTHSPSDQTTQDPPQSRPHQGFWSLAVTGLATSIDAMIVGVSLALLDVPIGVVAAVIGLCTFVMVTLGILLGRVLGEVVGKRAEWLGGLVLIGIGCSILLQHLRHP